MKTKIIHFTDENTSTILFSSFVPNGTTNSESRRKMKEIISKAIVTELTDMQRICLTEHYLNDKKQKEIASELGLLGNEEKIKELAAKAISEKTGELIVTPKEIDSLIECTSTILADGINMCLFGKDYAEVRSLIA